MCQNDGTSAAMEFRKRDTAMAAFVCYILCGGDEVRDTSQKEYATGGQGPHAIDYPNTSA